MNASKLITELVQMSFVVEAKSKLSHHLANLINGFLVHAKIINLFRAIECYKNFLECLEFICQPLSLSFDCFGVDEVIYSHLPWKYFVRFCASCVHLTETNNFFSLSNELKIGA